MATNPDSTTIRSIPAQGAHVAVCDPETGNYPMYVDGEPVGLALSPAQAEHTLDALITEILYTRTEWPAVQLPAPANAVLLPPVCAVAEALDDLARGAAEPFIYAQARAQLAAGVPVVFDGTTRWVDGVVVEIAPPEARWPWPWRCACGSEQCWHGALCDALLLAIEQQVEDGEPLTYAT